MTTREIQTIYAEKWGCAAIFQSKCQLVERGEQRTKYFFNFEKWNYNKKAIAEPRLQTNNNERVKEDNK